MKRKIMILNVLSYVKDKEKRSRLGYFCIDSDAFSDSEKFIGFSETGAFRDDHKFFEIPKEFIGQVCEATFEQLPNQRDPMKVFYKLVSLQFKDKLISFD